jgi:hypothetical protein
MGRPSKDVTRDSDIMIVAGEDLGEVPFQPWMDERARLIACGFVWLICTQLLLQIVIRLTIDSGQA